MDPTTSSSDHASGVTDRTHPPSRQHDSVGSTFATPDLLLDIIRHLIDDDFLPALSSLSLVSKNFHRASLSDRLWREVCYRRWKSKFGFRARWEKAVADCPPAGPDRGGRTTRRSPNDEPGSASDFWRARYFAQEEDAARSLILAEELEALTFDFRFWIGRPTVVDGRIVVRSGLLESASEEVRFSNAAPVSGNSEEEDDDDAGPAWSARGHLTGHPCGEPGIEWFLNEALGIVQWGFFPDLWPQGTVQRLDSWGWQIQNPNVVMRSIDPVPSSASMQKVSGWDETTLDEIERECSKSDGQSIATNDLWKDLLDTLENIPLDNTPEVNGFRVTADIPRAFMQQYM